MRGSLLENQGFGESGRRFDTANDGRTTYTVQPGDNLWSISKDLLQRQSSSPPTPQEITRAYQEIARENGIANPNLIHPGEKFVIPESLARMLQCPAEATPVLPLNEMERAPVVPVNAYSQLTASSPQTQPFKGVYNPIAPPGLVGDLDDHVSTSHLQKVDNPDGGTTTTYDGHLYDDWTTSGLLGTDVSAQTTLGPQGQIMKQNIAYAGSGKQLTFDCGGGKTKTIDGVSTIDVTYNAMQGNYETVINTRDGQQFKAYADSLGRVLSLQQQPN